MNRRDFLASASLAPLGAAQTAQAQPAAPAYRSISPFEVGDRAQLLIDDVLIFESKGVSRTQHPAEKHPANPLVKADKPWEGWRLEIYGNVIWDEDEQLFKMWYLGEAPNYFAPSPDGPSADNSTLYATSRDGIRWEKPPVGTLRSPSGEKHNAVLFATHLASTIKDKSDPDPNRRYKMSCYVDAPKEARGYHTMISPDGIRWTRNSQKPICRGADVINMCWDAYRKHWIALAKIGEVVRGTRRRVFWLITSNDFEHWTEPELVWTPDARDDASSFRRIEASRRLLDVPDDMSRMRTEFYGFGLYPQESCLLAFPWMFTINNNARYGNHEGPFELQMGVSRDLKEWARPFRTPCLLNGNPGEWDEGLIVTASQLFRKGDEIWLYYGGANYTHGTPAIYRAQGTRRGTHYTGSIGLAKWKLDRFASIDGPAQGGTVTTVPLIFTGNRLEINARTAKGGRITASLLDGAGNAIAGYENSNAFSGDQLRATLAWKGGRTPAELKGKPVSVRFHLQNAELFSFAFRS